MSADRGGPPAYQLVLMPEVQQAWAKLPPDSLRALRRELEELARTVGLRQWVSEAEAQEAFSLHVGAYELLYTLDPESRTLRVGRLTSKR